VAGGFPTRREMLDHYAELTGRDVSGIDYYRAFSYWRLAAIVEGVLARYLKGVMGKAADTSAFRAQVDGLAAAALERVRALGG
jgi:aminoglycoside phosphotransferase (APT) family kinase protein